MDRVRRLPPVVCILLLACHVVLGWAADAKTVSLVTVPIAEPGLVLDSRIKNIEVLNSAVYDRDFLAIPNRGPFTQDVGVCLDIDARHQRCRCLRGNHFGGENLIIAVLRRKLEVSKCSLVIDYFGLAMSGGDLRWGLAVVAKLHVKLVAGISHGPSRQNPCTVDILNGIGAELGCVSRFVRSGGVVSGSLRNPFSGLRQIATMFRFKSDLVESIQGYASSPNGHDNQPPSCPIWWPEPVVPILRLLFGSSCLWWETRLRRSTDAHYGGRGWRALRRLVLGLGLSLLLIPGGW
jgi:hypothetical protein